MKFGNRVRVYTSSTGTGDLNIDGARDNHASLSDVFAPNDQFPYTIDMGSGWEVGIATYRVTPTRIERTTIHAKYENGTYEANPATPLNVIAISDIICTIVVDPSGDVDIPHDGLVSVQGGAAGEHYHLTSAQHTLATGLIDPINDKKSPGDIGADTQGQGNFSAVSIGHGAAGYALDVKKDNALFLMQDTSTGGEFRFYPGSSWHNLNFHAPGPSYVSLNPVSEDNAGLAFFSLFRSTNTVGAREFRMYQGDGGAQIVNLISVTPGANSYINNGGNFGINTSNPGVELDVAGDARVFKDNPHLYFNNDQFTHPWHVAANVTNTFNGGISIGEGANNSGQRWFRISAGGAASLGNLTPNSNYGLTLNKALYIPDTVSLNPQIYLSTGIAGKSALFTFADALDYGYFQVGNWGSNTKIAGINPGGGPVLLGGTTTCVGNVVPNVHHTTDLGSASLAWRDIYSQNAPTQTSDARQKENIQDLDTLNVAGLIMGLRAVSFTHKPITESDIPKPSPPPQQQKQRYKAVMGVIEKPDPVTGRIIEIPGPVIEAEPVYDEVPIYDMDGNATGRFKRVPVMEDDLTVQPVGPPGPVIEVDNSIHFGFIAQEVEALLDTLGINPKDFAPLTYNSDADRYGFRYPEMIALMVEHMQAQQNTIDDLTSRVEALEAV